MKIEPLDPHTVDDATASRLAELANAVSAVDSPHLPPVSGRQLQLRLRHGWDGRGVDALLVGSDESGAIVASAEIELPHWDNQHLGIPDLFLRPGLPDELADPFLAETVALIRAAGRTTVLTSAWKESSLEDFWMRHDFEVGMVAAQRRLVLADLDQERLRDLFATSEQASPTYDIEELPNPAPAELVPGLVDLHLAMNDAPLDDLALEDDVWNEERLRAFEAAMSIRECRLHRLVARRRSDGVLGGHTVVVVEEERPWLAFQEDTAVVQGHRGHRLGLRLKLAMLDTLAKHEPQLEFIDTWNAESNTHMIAVNDAMGCVVVARGLELQKHLADS